MSNAVHVLQGARDFVVTGGLNFTLVNNVASPVGDAVSTLLFNQIAPGAIFDSAERYPPGKCHPGTRQRMINRIIAWINDADSNHNILWLHGPAGSGKSALAHTTCELLKKHYPGRYAGSFFFARGPKDRGKGAMLFPTLAYELAIHFPGMRSQVNHVLYHNPCLPTKSFDIQISCLIIQPLLACSNTWPLHTPTVIIDGLDECDVGRELETQPQIITLISEAIVEHKIPIRFMIASRPEYWIRDAFKGVPLPFITTHLCLRDDFDADRDIQRLLTEGFDSIRLENERVMDTVELPWPPLDTIQDFVRDASGQYIYASTVLDFVGKSGKFSNPLTQLRILTNPGPHRASAFTELDKLYATILSVYPRRETLNRVLGGLLADASVDTIEVILGVDSAEIALILDALSSLIIVSRPVELSGYEVHLEPIYGNLSTGHTQIKFAHLSFREFLEDEERSGPFHVDVVEVYNGLSRALVANINTSMENNYGIEPHILLNIGIAAYRRVISDMSNSVWECELTIFIQLIAEMFERLEAYMHWGGWKDMRHPICFIQHMLWIEALLIPPTATIPFVIKERKLRDSSVTSGLEELRTAAKLARRKCTRLLPPDGRVGVTPVLAYLRIFGSATVSTLFTIPGASLHDTTSTLQFHRHIIEIYPSGKHLIANLIYPNDGISDPKGSMYFSEVEWRDQRILLAHNCLDSILRNIENEWEYPPEKRNQFRRGDIRQTILGDFFDSSAMADIHSEDYFHNQYKMSILQLLIDPSAWSRSIPHRPRLWETVSDTVVPVLCWLNRQLNNAESIRLIESHDETLLRAMAATMKDIFNNLIVPAMTVTNSRNELQFSIHPTRYVANQGTTNIIHVTPLPDVIIEATSHYWEEEIPYSAPEFLYYLSIERIHKELFESETWLAQEPSCCPTPAMATYWYTNLANVIRGLRGKEIDRNIMYDNINPGDSWYPLLANFLLVHLAEESYYSMSGRKIQMTRLYPEYHGSLSNNLRSYVVECLPYAYPTKQNLDALRLLRFTCFRTSTGAPPILSRMPHEFYSRAAEFLMKYDDSLLSREELKNFKRWLSELGRQVGGKKNFCLISYLR